MECQAEINRLSTRLPRFPSLPVEKSFPRADAAGTEHPVLSVYRDLEVDFTRDETRMMEPPLLDIDISSPTQGIQDLVDKARFLMEHGVESCWIVQPPLGTITVFTPDMESTTYSSGTVTDPATEVEVNVDAIFSME